MPEVKNKAWVKNPIDAFVLEKLEREKLSPAPQADKNTLMRRLSLDLVGLPPTLDELATAGDPAKEIDRLIASPHFGERWGREWLDAARYSDSAGYEKDLPRYHHFYRDWVVSAMNQNMPYDDFVIKQIAGDLLPNACSVPRNNWTGNISFLNYGELRKKHQTHSGRGQADDSLSGSGAESPRLCLSQKGGLQ